MSYPAPSACYVQQIGTAVPQYTLVHDCRAVSPHAVTRGRRFFARVA
jgi:hypothetical protein